eukprot:1157879-Pelagomonas_calceolata.AAC.6
MQESEAEKNSRPAAKRPGLEPFHTHAMSPGSAFAEAACRTFTASDAVFTTSLLSIPCLHTGCQWEKNATGTHVHSYHHPHQCVQREAGMNLWLLRLDDQVPSSAGPQDQGGGGRGRHSNLSACLGN